MFCTKCGFSMGEGDKVCPQCFPQGDNQPESAPVVEDSVPVVGEVPPVVGEVPPVVGEVPPVVGEVPPV
ncbi:MAG: hypothetical protein R3Y63_14295, partial [Eubacteriales bacterium]